MFCDFQQNKHITVETQIIFELNAILLVNCGINVLIGNKFL